MRPWGPTVSFGINSEPEILTVCVSVSVCVCQLEEAQKKAQDLEETVSQLEKTLVQEGALLTYKDSVIQAQSLKEKELMAAVHR